MKKLAMFVLCAAITCTSVEFAAAGTAKKASRPKELTAEQRHKVMEIARALCKRKYGAGASVWRLDYKYMRLTCLEG